MALLVGRDAVCPVYLLKGRDLLQASAQRQNLHAGRRADVIISVGTLYDAADDIGRKALVLVEDIDDGSVDGDGEAVVIGPDPEAPFIVDIKGVHIVDGFVIIHPAEFISVVTVQAGVCADPEDSVGSLGDVIGLSAGEAVFAVKNRLHIVAVIGTVWSRGGAVCCRII